jgi:hypothetical protein
LPSLEKEGIVVSDEGMKGWFITKKVNGPAKRYRNRVERFSGCLVITRKQMVCYSYWKRQISIPVDHPKIFKNHYSVFKENILSVAFETSVVMDGKE